MYSYKVEALILKFILRLQRFSL